MTAVELVIAGAVLLVLAPGLKLLGTTLTGCAVRLGAWTGELVREVWWAAGCGVKGHRWRDSRMPTLTGWVSTCDRCGAQGDVPAAEMPARRPVWR